MLLLLLTFVACILSLPIAGFDDIAYDVTHVLPPLPSYKPLGSAGRGWEWLSQDVWLDSSPVGPGWLGSLPQQQIFLTLCDILVSKCLENRGYTLGKSFFKVPKILTFCTQDVITICLVRGNTKSITGISVMPSFSHEWQRRPSHSCSVIFFNKEKIHGQSLNKLACSVIWEVSKSCIKLSIMLVLFPEYMYFIMGE